MNDNMSLKFRVFDYQQKVKALNKFIVDVGLEATQFDEYNRQLIQIAMAKEVLVQKALEEYG